MFFSGCVRGMERVVEGFWRWNLVGSSDDVDVPRLRTA